MDIRYAANPKDAMYYSTEDLRDEFLIQDLYQADTVQATYSHVDRMVVLGIMPVEETVSIDKGLDIWANFGTHYFFERREAGVFNLGGKGSIIADGETYELEYEDCMYITLGTKDVKFVSADKENPAKFYLVSCPADRACRNRLLHIKDAAKTPAGSPESANARVINKFIHPDVLETCKLQMGLTQLQPGSVWNTMPAHTHERRMEIYTYFEIPEGQTVFHFMGEPQETRHIVMHNFDAVISPSWSIHCGCGTANYTFIWAMTGENQAYDDMDVIPIPELL